MVYRRYGYRRNWRRRHAVRFAVRSYSRRRRSYGRARKLNSATDQSGYARGLTYRSRGLRRKAFSRLIWKNTIASDHWRSFGSSTVAGRTAAAQLSGTITRVLPLFQGNSPFWTAAGGAQPTDTGGTVPLFQGDIILRGGMISQTVSIAPLSSDQIAVDTWIVWTQPSPRGIVPTTAGWGWDPTSTADFVREVGKPRHFKRTILSTNQLYVTIDYRLPCMKIDQSVFQQSGRQPMLLTMVTNLTSTTAAAYTIIYKWNVSYSGDAIGTT